MSKLQGTEKNIVGGALYYLEDESSSNDLARGVVIGLISATMALEKCDYVEAIETIFTDQVLTPRMIRRLPPQWVEDIVEVADVEPVEGAFVVTQGLECGYVPSLIETFLSEKEAMDCAKELKYDLRDDGFIVTGANGDYNARRPDSTPNTLDLIIRVVHADAIPFREWQLICKESGKDPLEYYLKE